jgi:pentatricopeptide repeat protein
VAGQRPSFESEVCLDNCCRSGDAGEAIYVYDDAVLSTFHSSPDLPETTMRAGIGSLELAAFGLARDRRYLDLINLQWFFMTSGMNLNT